MRRLFPFFYFLMTGFILPGGELISLPGVAEHVLEEAANAGSPPTPECPAPTQRECSDSINVSIGTPPAGRYPSFYRKYLEVNGFPIMSSGTVSDAALIKAAQIVRLLTRRQPQLISSLRQLNVRAGVMGRNEMTTDIPEHAFLANDQATNWNQRARGLGATKQVPIVTGAEENLLELGHQHDRYHGEDIFLHEFSHSIHLVLREYYPQVAEEIEAQYHLSLARGNLNQTYGATNVEEYFAELTQSWFNRNIEGPSDGDGSHNDLNTQAEVRAREPGMTALFSVLYGSDTSLPCVN